jgi:hypothetical protein
MMPWQCQFALPLKVRFFKIRRYSVGQRRKAYPITNFSFGQIKMDG